MLFVTKEGTRDISGDLVSCFSNVLLLGVVDTSVVGKVKQCWTELAHGWMTATWCPLNPPFFCGW